nr:MAG TPA: hypothetical protein [Bacteriophage sp.]
MLINRLFKTLPDKRVDRWCFIRFDPGLLFTK